MTSIAMGRMNILLIIFSAALAAEASVLIDSIGQLTSLTDTVTAVVYKPISVNANTTIHKNVTIEFADSGLFNIGDIDSLKILGPIIAPLKQLFRYSSARVKVRFNGNCGISAIYPQWWGAQSDDTLPDNAAFQRTIRSALTMPPGVTVIVSPGNYVVADTIKVVDSADAGTQITISGYGAELKPTRAFDGSMILIRGINPELDGGENIHAGRITIAGLTLREPDSVKHATGVKLHGVSGARIKDIIVRNLHTGIELRNADLTMIEGCDIEGCDTAGIRVESNTAFGTTSHRYVLNKINHCARGIWIGKGEKNHIEANEFVANDTAILLGCTASDPIVSPTVVNNRFELTKHIDICIGTASTSVRSGLIEGNLIMPDSTATVFSVTNVGEPGEITVIRNNKITGAELNTKYTPYFHSNPHIPLYVDNVWSKEPGLPARRNSIISDTLGGVTVNGFDSLSRDGAFRLQMPNLKSAEYTTLFVGKGGPSPVSGDGILLGYKHGSSTNQTGFFGIWGYNAALTIKDTSVGVGKVPEERLDIEGSNSDHVAMKIKNTNTGASAYSELCAQSNSGAQAKTGVTSSSNSGDYKANAAYFLGSQDNGTLSKTILGSKPKAPVEFWMNNAAKMIIDTAGHLGLGRGVSSLPSGWSSVYDVIRLGDALSLSGNNNGAKTGYLSNNTYFNGSNDVYLGTGYASQINLDASGNINFATAGSGDSGTSANLSTRMQISNAGNVGIGTTSPSGILHVEKTGSSSENFFARLRKPSLSSGNFFDLSVGVSDGNNVLFGYCHNSTYDDATGYMAKKNYLGRPKTMGFYKPGQINLKKAMFLTDMEKPMGDMLVSLAPPFHKEVFPLVAKTENITNMLLLVKAK